MLKVFPTFRKLGQIVIERPGRLSACHHSGKPEYAMESGFGVA